MKIRGMTGKELNDAIQLESEAKDIIALGKAMEGMLALRQGSTTVGIMPDEYISVMAGLLEQVQK